MNKCLLVQIVCALDVQKLIVSPTLYGKFCVWALLAAINVSVAFCQLAACKFSSFGKMSNGTKYYYTISHLIELSHELIIQTVIHN